MCLRHAASVVWAVSYGRCPEAQRPRIEGSQEQLSYTSHDGNSTSAPTLGVRKHPAGRLVMNPDAGTVTDCGGEGRKEWGMEINVCLSSHPFGAFKCLRIHNARQSVFHSFSATRKEGKPAILVSATAGSLGTSKYRCGPGANPKIGDTLSAEVGQCGQSVVTTVSGNSIET